MVEASPRRIFANAHTYHINSISINSDAETYLSADDLRYFYLFFTFLFLNPSNCGVSLFKKLDEFFIKTNFFFFRINLWHMEITDQSFNIVDIKPANMEELTEVITASEFHPKECNHFVYSSSKGTIRLCDMRQAALCDTHAKRKCTIREYLIRLIRINLFSHLLQSSRSRKIQRIAVSFLK